MVDKTAVLAYYRQSVQDRIDAFRDMIAALAEDSRNDAKGSAGDKHETALSMMHLEQEKLNRKLAELYAQRDILQKIDAAVVHSRTAVGSLVVANGMLLFVSAALPKITVDGTSVIAVSPQSPLGMELMGKEAGSSFTVGNTRYTITEIY